MFLNFSVFSRGPNNWSDAAGGGCGERTTDSDCWVSADRRADLPSNGGRAEQDWPTASQQETECHWENDQETTQNTGEHQVCI